MYVTNELKEQNHTLVVIPSHVPTSTESVLFLCRTGDGRVPRAHLVCIKICLQYQMYISWSIQHTLVWFNKKLPTKPRTRIFDEQPMETRRPSIHVNQSPLPPPPLPFYFCDARRDQVHVSTTRPSSDPSSLSFFLFFASFPSAKARILHSALFLSRGEQQIEKSRPLRLAQYVWNEERQHKTNKKSSSVKVPILGKIKLSLPSWAHSFGISVDTKKVENLLRSKKINRHHREKKKSAKAYFGCFLLVLSWFLRFLYVS